MVLTHLQQQLVATSVEERSGREVSVAIAELAASWEALRIQQGLGPFGSAAWMRVYAEHEMGASQPRLVLARRGSDLVGALPLLVERRPIARLPARILRSLSDDHSQRFDALLADQDAADAIIGHLARRPDWDVVELRDLAPEARAHLLVSSARRAGWPTGTWEAMRSPYLPLPKTADELETGLSSRFRSNLRRRWKKAEEEIGELVLERIPCESSPAELAAALEDGFRLEAAGWKGRAGTAIQCDPLLQGRYASLALAFAREGKLALFFLRAAGRRISFHYALEDNGVYYLFKPGYEPEMSRYGTGHALIAAVARDLIRRGFGELDFLGDEMAWKAEWTDKTRPHAWHYLFNPGLRGRALHAAKFWVLPRARRLVGLLRR